MISIEPPFSIDFDILRNTLSSANTAKIRIYNLSAETRNRILKNPNVGEKRLVILRAGYGINLPMILSGYITQCFSVREGTNFVTTIESFDAGFAYVNAVYNGSPFPKGTLYKNVILSLIQSLEKYGVGIGQISDFPGTLDRGYSPVNPTVDELRGFIFSNFPKAQFFIDNGLAYALNDSDSVKGPIEYLDAETGLLGTPVRNENILNFEMLFEPRLIMSQSLYVKSSTASLYSGNYKVISLHHKGTISPVVSGDATTAVGCLGGDTNTINALIGAL